MLLGDRRVAALPAVAELVQVGEDDGRQRRVERCCGEQAIDDLVRPLLVEGGQRGPEFLPCLGRRTGDIFGRGV